MSFASDDSGSATLTTVLLTPVFVVIAFAAFQAAMWTHARTEARAVARDAAALVARAGEPADVVARSATDTLNASDIVDEASVVISNNGSFVTVRITGEAPGIMRGTTSGFEVTEALPVEGFRP